MATLNAKERNALPNSDFAGPNRTYPIEDRAHAIDALARAHANASAALQVRIEKAVYSKFPDLKPDPSK